MSGIDRVRLSGAAKQQLSTLKRRTGIEHYNVLCRHAICASLAQSLDIPDEALSFVGGLEIDWDTLAGDAGPVYVDLICTKHSIPSTSPELRKLVSLHVHRGLSFMLANSDALVPAP
ncbi:DNA sulfur modification protein DndE [Caenimonas terrae]|uniref:DNA sulfur modification protein DndE n=1 Tax=Caenimonas terrae TaxID=696074 RepID=A0ABW0N8U0_9BURK